MTTSHSVSPKPFLAKTLFREAMLTKASVVAEDKTTIAHSKFPGFPSFPKLHFKKLLVLCTMSLGLSNVLFAQSAEQKESGKGQGNVRAAEAVPTKTNEPAPTPVAPVQTVKDHTTNMESQKAERERMLKMTQLRKEIKEAENAGNGAAPEVEKKREELKKMQDEQRTKLMADQERRRKEQQAKDDKKKELNQKITDLNREIREAEEAGRGSSEEITKKKEALNKFQDEWKEMQMTEREAMGKERQMPSQQEMEMHKKIASLRKEIKQAEQEGKAESPETEAKKSELKKIQEELNQKRKAARATSLQGAVPATTTPKDTKTKQPEAK